MKIIIEDGIFSHTADWDRKQTVEDGFAEEYRPDVGECVESFLRLLENIHPRESISGYIDRGVEYSGKP